MEWTINKYESTTVHHMAVDFGITDRFKRRIGCLLEITIYGPTGTIRSAVQSTRNGIAYGASAGGTTHPVGTDLDTIKADLIKRGEQSRKRQAKTHAGGAR